jgi:NAD(P)-dependent dehydrogenase (short-subunit alcohol dehydrogenase family)
MKWPQEDFQGRVAVVTGAANGLGRACAKALLEAGADVVAVDLDEARLAGIVSAGARAAAGNLTDPGFRSDLLAHVGPFDFLVNAAGIVRLQVPDVITEADWDAQFDVNAKALFFLCRVAGAHLRRGGGIVNFSSIAARTGRTPETFVYAGTKSAVMSFTRSFSTWYAPRGVRVNAVLPGVFETPMNDQIVAAMTTGREVSEDELSRARLAGTPLARNGMPPECADAVMWLLSTGSSYVTGQGIAVDGGVTMT